MLDEVRSFKYMTKVSGPSQIPCGPAPIKSTHSEYTLPISTLCFLEHINENIERINNLWTPEYVIIFSRMLWSTPSKALLKSTRSVLTDFPSSKAQDQWWRILINVCMVKQAWSPPYLTNISVSSSFMPPTLRIEDQNCYLYVVAFQQCPLHPAVGRGWALLCLVPRIVSLRCVGCRPLLVRLVYSALNRISRRWRTRLQTNTRL